MQDRDQPSRAAPGIKEQAASAMSAAEVARLVATRRVSASAVIEQVVDRMRRLNPELNALVALRCDEALEEARQLDGRIRSGEAVGALAGVPFTVKDVIATRGLATTCGSRVVAGRITDHDSTVITRMRAAGAILVGKTNCSEFAFSIDTDNDRYGRTRNPLGPFTPGGSSGGESSALAAGLSAAGLGTDFGGSIRWPAQCTGVVGLRPTVGRVPGSGQLPGVSPDGYRPPNPLTLQGRLQVISPMGRGADDVELILRVIAGPDDLDPAAVPAPLGRADAVRLEEVECRWGVRAGDMTVADDVAAVVSRAAEALARHGARLSPGLPGALERAHDLFSTLRRAEPYTELRGIVARQEDQLTAHTRKMLAGSRPETHRRLSELWVERDVLRRELLTWLHGDRLLLLPVSTVPPFVPGTIPSLSGRELEEADVVAPCRLVSLFGLPAISVPFGRGAEGAPLSVQLVAPPFREDLLLAAARHLHDPGSTEAGAD
ncbi:amidase [Nonomuraea sp. NPDC048916]|uniref:amidase n=1 Tax=Nonomuraea sp. NPDC048916 TaxID=3154232 RepID=UPI0033EB398A